MKSIPLVYTLALIISILSSCNKNQNIETTSKEEPEVKSVNDPEYNELIRLLDQNEITKAWDYALKLKTTRAGIDQLSLLLFDCSHSRYNAKKIIDDGKTIRLQGNFWIRSGDQLIDGMQDDKSYVIIHKKTMRIVKIEGEYELTHLLAYPTSFVKICAEPKNEIYPIQLERIID